MNYRLYRKALFLHLNIFRSYSLSFLLKDITYPIRAIATDRVSFYPASGDKSLLLLILLFLVVLFFLIALFVIAAVPVVIPVIIADIFRRILIAFFHT